MLYIDTIVIYACSHVVCWVFSRCGSRLLRIWSSLSRYISRICSLIKYKVHISDYIPYFYTFSLRDASLLDEMYICDIYTVIFFRIEPRKGDYGEFFRKFKALEKIWENWKFLKTLTLIWNWKLNNSSYFWKDN